MEKPPDNSGLKLWGCSQPSCLPSWGLGHQRTVTGSYCSPSKFRTHRNYERGYRDACSNPLSLGMTCYPVIDSRYGQCLYGALICLPGVWLTHNCLWLQCSLPHPSVVARVTGSSGTGGGSRLFKEVSELLALEESICLSSLTSAKGSKTFLSSAYEGTNSPMMLDPGSAGCSSQFPLCMRSRQGEPQLPVEALHLNMT